MKRKNGQTIGAEWFNSLEDELTAFEREYDLANNQSATELSEQVFDGEQVSSVGFDYEVQRGTTVFANGEVFLQNLNGTWRLADRGFAGEEHGVSFSVAQVGQTAKLTAATDGQGTGKLKIKRRIFSVS